MKKMLSALAAFVVIQASAFAILPPLYQGLDEIKTIVSDERIGQHLQSGDVILAIEKVDNGYLIKTNKGNVLAKVTYKPSEMPGKAHFKIEFEKQ